MVNLLQCSYMIFLFIYLSSFSSTHLGCQFSMQVLDCTLFIFTLLIKQHIQLFIIRHLLSDYVLIQWLWFFNPYVVHNTSISGSLCKYIDFSTFVNNTQVAYYQAPEVANILSRTSLASCSIALLFFFTNNIQCVWFFGDFLNNILCYIN